MVVVRAGTVGAALVLALMSLVLITGASSAETRKSREIAKQRAKAQSVAKAITLMEEHMEVGEDGKLVLDKAALAEDVAGGEAAGVSAATFDSLEAALRKTNGEIEAGETTAAEVFSSEPEVQGGGITTLRRCDGINGTYYRWWGYRSFLNDCATHTLGRLLLIGATANAIAAYFGWVPGGLIGPIMVIGAVVIDHIDERGGHDGVYFTKVYGVGTTIWHQ
jgi:hypothetical protein